ncbi:Gamma-glutamyltranspeptidase [Enhygromyxa salina]|uniref:Glutathione hydrolase proenzyme n=1 Tax=Enhygromyxa salina TaxID=215803 RepID=A0A0C2CMN7_9BACT|nr:gamma-glutamyltransferase [Enhygromyxa salina]KIG12526.1 Gamma-glutamyltranspeptidase [Enhygromyxa salina]
MRRSAQLLVPFAFLLAGVVSFGSGCKDSSSSETPSVAESVEQGPTPTAPAELVMRLEPVGEPAPLQEQVEIARGKLGAVASAESNASRIGVEILKAGGNAVDAAVAVGFALSVTHPSAGNIGGGGFMVLRFPDGVSRAVDYRETAPGAATADMYLDDKGELTDQSRTGAKAAGIPGDVAGFWYAHQQWGKLEWRQVVEPAVVLARDGWTLDESHAEDLEWGSQRMADAGLDASAASFRKPDGSNYAAGEVWRQPELAATLQRIADQGRDGFYAGDFAAYLAAQVQDLGGIWTVEDLANYQPVERDPLVFTYHGHEIIAMPPPSAGGVVLRQILAASEVMHLERLAWHSPAQVHAYVEILRRTYADRNLLLGDPDFVKIPMQTLLDVSYIDERVADINPKKATPSDQVGAGVEVKESEQTTHFSVVDANGLAVANTYTLNGGFGSKVIVPGTGVILNNEMDDFTAKVGSPNMFGLIQGPQNAIAPGKRMLSSMTPTIVVKDGKLRAVVGSPGGPTITTTVAQIILQLIDYDRPLEDAVREFRIHHQWKPDNIWYEEGMDPALEKALEKMGHELKTRGRRIGHANCIAVDPVSGEFEAVADVARDGGSAAAY